jgi:hypothetical protein
MLGIDCEHPTVETLQAIPYTQINIKKKLNKFYLKRQLAAPSLYERQLNIFKSPNIQHICHKPITFIQFLPTN